MDGWKTWSSSSTTLEKLVLGGDAEDTFVDRRPSSPPPIVHRPSSSPQKRKRAWIDEDDDADHSDDRKNRILGTPSWAELPTADGEDDDDFARRVDHYIVREERLRPDTVDFEKCRPLNYDCAQTDAKKPPIQCLEFHPKARVALVAALGAKSAHLVQVDGKANARIQTVPLKDHGADCAHFAVDGEQFVVGSNRRRSYFYYDMMAGKAVQVPANKGVTDAFMGYFVVSPGQGRLMAVPGSGGKINLICAKSKEWLCDFKANSNVAALAFDTEAACLYSHGDEGEVYVWDMRSHRCLHKFHDDGCIKGTAVALSPNGQYLACGNDSGVVNVYEREAAMTSSSPKPIKSILNLTTSINQVKFNSASEILVASSRFKKDAVRLIHLPSFKTFSNFPEFNAFLGQPTCVDFSANSGYLAVGGPRDSAHLFRLSHYGNY